MVCIFKFFHESKPHGLMSFKKRLKTRHVTVPNEWSSIFPTPLRQRMVCPFKLNWLFSCCHHETHLRRVWTQAVRTSPSGKKCFVPVRGSTLDVHVHFMQSKWESIGLTTKKCCLLAMRIEAAKKKHDRPTKKQICPICFPCMLFLRLSRSCHTNSSKQVQHQCDDCIHHRPADSINMSI